jgi:hypothetical protein
MNVLDASSSGQRHGLNGREDEMSQLDDFVYHPTAHADCNRAGS